MIGHKLGKIAKFHLLPVNHPKQRSVGKCKKCKKQPNFVAVRGISLQANFPNLGKSAIRRAQPNLT